MADSLPKVLHEFTGNILESRRWQHFSPRDNDIIIATSMKSGTTWMQAIVREMILDVDANANISELSPWFEMGAVPIDELTARLEAQTHRRSVKTHLPLDALCYFPQVKYIVVGRDARDVCLSMWSHYQLNKQEIDSDTSSDNDDDNQENNKEEITDFSTFYEYFMSRGKHEWETEGYPFWGNLRHTQTWWDYKHLPNILFVHFQNLLDDTGGQIQRVAEYLDISLTTADVTAIIEKTSFATMKENANVTSPMFRDGVGEAQFFNQGINGRWKSILSEEQLALYHAAVKRELTSDCAHWIETGQMD